MTTAWQTPTTIIQYPEEGAENIHVQWDNTNNFANIKYVDESYVGTMTALEHSARSPKTDITNKTYYLCLTGYNFTDVPEVISGIEVRLTSNRKGRVADDTIQLCYNGALLGENQADLIVNPLKIYGGTTNLWGAENLTPSMVTDSSFGVVLRFRSHPSWPHRDPAFINSVEIRIS